MYHLDNESGVSTMPPIAGVNSTTPLWFTESPPSYPGADWFNVVQAEFLNVLTDAGIEPQKNDLSQLSKAIQSMIFGGFPVGIPLPYPGTIPPEGFLKCNGAAFNKTQYPRLAAVYPSGVLPDLRGEFIRGWDDGRGVDSGRVMGSEQASSYQNHTHGIGVQSISFGTGGITQGFGSATSISTTSAGGNETRPRNVAFLYIVRAA